MYLWFTTAEVKCFIKFTLKVQKNLLHIYYSIFNFDFVFLTDMTILHLWIHSLDFLLRVASHLRCGHLKYNETSDIKDDCEKALREIQKVICVFKSLIYI